MNTKKSDFSLYAVIAAPNTNQWTLRASLYDELLRASGRKPLTSGGSLSGFVNRPFVVLSLAPKDLVREFDICSTLAIPVVIHGQIPESVVVELINNYKTYDSPAIDMVSFAAGEYFGKHSRVMMVLEVSASDLELLRVLENPEEPDRRRFFTAQGRSVDPAITARLYIETSEGVDI